MSIPIKEVTSASHVIKSTFNDDLKCKGSIEVSQGDAVDFVLSIELADPHMLVCKDFSIRNFMIWFN